MRKTFLVGRLTSRSSEMIMAEETRTAPPFPGPWTLRALVRLPEPHRHPLPGSATVH